MDAINQWLDELIKHWKEKNVAGVLKLFSGQVEYWETPYKKISPAKLKQEWNGIHDQDDLSIKCKVFSKDDNRYAINWDLNYIDKSKKHKHYKGVYLLTLNNQSLCDYFLQCGESDQ